MRAFPFPVLLVSPRLGCFSISIFRLSAPSVVGRVSHLPLAEFYFTKIFQFRFILSGLSDIDDTYMLVVMCFDGDLNALLQFTDMLLCPRRDMQLKMIELLALFLSGPL
ncbi:hypothetical protein V6N11_036509 [Hibiscus sabdariffa]|uniref:Secreted protein n=1 Tax=Hibiscus sabdariffa TaxID=183260 RepID=A0ABR2RAN5_9ROSI